MNDPLKLQEAGWRRKLTPAEEAELQAWLAKHPEAQADWKAEVGLNEGLRGLPDAPMPSNFTARVLQAVEREEAAAGRPALTWKSTWNWLLPKAAFVAAVFGVALFT